MDSRGVTLKELARVFFKLGCIGFGGPAAHIAMMQREIVEKKKWLTDQEFLDLIGITNLIPGPNSTELAIHIGYTTHGWRGLIVSGFCFIFPAVLSTTLLAYMYKQYGSIPEVDTFIYGLKPTILIIISLVLYNLCKKFLTSTKTILHSIIIVILSFIGYSEISLLLLTICISSLIYTRNKGSLFTILPLMTTVTTELNSKLFLSFLKIGSILYGSGYVLFSFIETEFVQKNLLSQEELINAITVGQITPGPLFSSVTFVGYQINGLEGAFTSTLGVFIPSFIFTLLAAPIVHKIKKYQLLQYILKTVNITSIALISSVLISISKEVITDYNTILIALFILAIMLKFKKINTGLILLIGAFTGKVLLLF